MLRPKCLHFSLRFFIEFSLKVFHFPIVQRSYLFPTGLFNGIPHMYITLISCLVGILETRSLGREYCHEGVQRPPSLLAESVAIWEV